MPNPWVSVGAPIMRNMADRSGRGAFVTRIHETAVERLG